MYNFIEQNYIEIERGVEYMNYQKDDAMLTNFWQKKRLKDHKNEEITRKKGQKLTKKSRNMWQFWTSNAFSGSAKHCGINFRGLRFNIASNKHYFYEKANCKQKKGHLDEKTAKNRYLYVPFSQKLLFKVKKSFTKRSAWSKNFSRSEKISSHCNFTHFRFQVKKSSERIVLPVKQKP